MMHSYQYCTSSVLIQWFSSVVVLRRMTGTCHGVRMRREMSIRGSIVTHFSPIYKRTAVSKAPLCGCLVGERRRGAHPSIEATCCWIQRSWILYLDTPQPSWMQVTTGHLPATIRFSFNQPNQANNIDVSWNVVCSDAPYKLRVHLVLSDAPFLLVDNINLII